jgi:pyridoxine kinase
VLTTSLRRWDAAADTIEMLAVSEEGAWLVQTPMLALEVNGAGDATAALFLAHLLRYSTLAEALSHDGFDRLRRAGRDAQDGLERCISSPCRRASSSRLGGSRQGRPARAR